MHRTGGAPNSELLEQQPVSKGAPYALYAAIIVLIIGGNFFRVATQNMSWTFGIYRSNACWFLLALAAALMSMFSRLMA